MKTYETYKDSGVEWIGEIPEHWEIKKLKYLTLIGNGKDHKDVWDENGEFSIIGTGGEFGKANAYLFDKPSVILGRKGTIDKPMFIDKPFWAVDTAYFTISKDNTDTKYLFYLSNTINFGFYKYGSTVPSMNQEQLKEIYFSVPPTKEEQTVIANYLDKKTAAIDHLIAEKEQLVALYQEEKTAIINQAVTKGIKPNVKLRDSGIEWLGNIPEHWEVKKLRFLCKTTTGDKDTENREDDAEYPFFVRSQTVERISSYSYDGEAILTAGDGVGVCKIWHYINGKFDFHQRVYMMYDFQEISGKLLFQFLKQNFIHEVLKKSAKSTVDSLRRPMFLDFPVAYSKDETEQTQIVQYIEKESARIDAKITKAEQYINLLTEYRTALISEVVTGKIKVF